MTKSNISHNILPLSGFLWNSSGTSNGFRVEIKWKSNVIQVFFEWKLMNLKWNSSVFQVETYGIQVANFWDVRMVSNGIQVVFHFKWFSSGNIWISSGIQVFFKWKFMNLKWNSSGFQVETYGIQVEFNWHFWRKVHMVSNGIQVVNHFKWLSSGIIWISSGIQVFFKWKFMNLKWNSSGFQVDFKWRRKKRFSMMSRVSQMKSNEF